MPCRSTASKFLRWCTVWDMVMMCWGRDIRDWHNIGRGDQNRHLVEWSREENQFLQSQVCERHPAPHHELISCYCCGLWRGTLQNGKIALRLVLKFSQLLQATLDLRVCPHWVQLGREIRKLLNKGLAEAHPAWPMSSLGAVQNIEVWTLCDAKAVSWVLVGQELSP